VTAPQSKAPSHHRRLPLRRRIKKRIWRVGTAIGKRSNTFRRVVRYLLRLERTALYRRTCRRNPVDDRTVTFEAFMGRGYNDSPKALYEAMLADPRFDDFTFVWAFRIPENFEDRPELARAQIVAYRSPEHYAAYARSRHWVSNSITPGHVAPRGRQTLIQTWHGTPLKRLGCDLAEGGTVNAKYSTREIRERYALEGEKLTYLLSPSAFASQKFASAFCMTPQVAADKIVEEGYPRNDALFSLGEADVARIRERLGVPQGKKAVLYAPTWRDDQHVSGMGYTLALPVDFDRLQRDLGDEYVILFRAHYFIANEFDFERYAGFVIDVSGVDDINELYVASDMLVTDYSSVFFDYANLKRPIVFYMYDLEAYAHDLRGFYLDLDELPGPIVRTEDELVSALRAAHAPDEELAARYHRFNERFTYLDDGHASERVVDRVIAERTGT
jgi:CDP-glycerol glycerophosphotransferase